LKTITSHHFPYTAFLWALLKPLGAWDVFAIAGVDASLIGMPLDAIVAAYVYPEPFPVSCCTRICRGARRGRWTRSSLSLI
jgi:hypothetical protein